MIDSSFPLNEAAKHIPRSRGRSIHISTLIRWVKRGVRGVKLQAFRLGGRWYTSKEAIDEFVSGLTEDKKAVSSPQKKSLEKRKDQKRQEVVERELSAFGL